MQRKFGKLFRNLNTNKLEFLEFNQNYYNFAKKNSQNNHNQFHVSDELLIKIIEHFLLKENYEIISIEFFLEDDELNKEIIEILRYLKKNKKFWTVLKSKLLDLVQCDDIHIKKVSFKCLIGNGSMFLIQKNGIIITSISDFDKISSILIKIVNEYSIT